MNASVIFIDVEPCSYHSAWIQSCTLWAGSMILILGSTLEIPHDLDLTPSCKILTHYFSVCLLHSGSWDDEMLFHTEGKSVAKDKPSVLRGMGSGPFGAFCCPTDSTINWCQSLCSINNTNIRPIRMTASMEQLLGYFPKHRQDQHVQDALRRHYKREWERESSQVKANGVCSLMRSLTW